MKTRYATEDVAVDSLEGRGQERSSGGHRSGMGFVKKQVLKWYTGILAFPLLFLNCFFHWLELYPLLRSLSLLSLSW